MTLSSSQPPRPSSRDESSDERDRPLTLQERREAIEQTVELLYAQYGDVLRQLAKE